LICVIILAAIGTLLLPAGQYNKLAVAGQSFTMTTGSRKMKQKNKS
jgi:uncharacterized ion transporter superfamily protein YfcC